MPDNLEISDLCFSCGKSIPPLPRADALCVACRYKRSGAPLATGPSADEIELANAFTLDPIPEETAPDEIRADRGDVTKQPNLIGLLEWLSRGGSIIRAGERALALAHVCGCGVFKTDAALALKLNMSRGRISQLRTEIDGFLPGVNGNRRQKIKRRRTGDRNNKIYDAETKRRPSCD